ncbi:hypothetical protein D9611_009975 [Ephemerocybe angulata]|uniref:Uncharacterized protein n=1 Tax=Ephemerocybe angulata TaxID=980116 RepID=A0A8H5FF85_9AGAR|nr:hypothetical protein D9611_009975 [Tulosesus angulatus]
MSASFHATRRLRSTHASCTRPLFPLQDSNHTRELDPIRSTTASYSSQTHPQPTMHAGTAQLSEMAVRGTKAPPPLTQPAALPPLRPNPSIRRSDASSASLHAIRRQPAPPFDASIVHSRVPLPLHDLEPQPRSSHSPRLRWPAEPTVDMHEHLAQRPTVNYTRLPYDENTYRKLNSGSVINNTLSPARAVDPTPPQLPSTMAVRRTSAVAGLTVIKSESFRPHVACRAHEKRNLQEHDLQRKTGHVLNQSIDNGREPSVECARKTSYLGSQNKPNGSRNQDFRNLQKTANICRSTARNFSKPGSTCEDSPPPTQKSSQPTTLTEGRQPRAFPTDGVNFATCTDTTTTTPASQQQVGDRRNITLTDNGTPSLSSFRQRTGRPTKGECARNWIAGISKRRPKPRHSAFGPSKQYLRRRLRQCQKLRQAVLDVRRKPFAAGRPRRRTTLEATADGTGQWDGRRPRLSLLQPNSCEAEMERGVYYDPADTSDHTSDPPRRQHPTLNKYRTSRTLHHQNRVAGRRKSRILPTDAAVVFGSPGQRVHRCIYKATRTPAAQAHHAETDNGLAAGGLETDRGPEAFNESYRLPSSAGGARHATKPIRGSSLGCDVSGVPGFMEREVAGLWCRRVPCRRFSRTAYPLNFTGSGTLDVHGDGEGQDRRGLGGTEDNGVGVGPP